MTERRWMNAEEGLEASRLIAEGFAQGLAQGGIDLSLSDRTLDEQAEARRVHELRHQFQEFTDTTQRWHDGEEVTPGDCWRACLASLLEVPLAEVPHFIHLYPAADVEGETPDWWEASVTWVQQQRPGWTLAAYDRPEPWVSLWHPDMYQFASMPKREILTAPSPRGDWMHSVIVDAVTGELDHDPFPGGQGVLPGDGDRVALVRIDWLEADHA